jgi:uncharacterized membrane protein YgcG
MRKLLLIAGLALGVLGLGPVAGASADIKFQASCTVFGNATFPEGLYGSKTTTRYEFQSDPNPVNPTPFADAEPSYTTCSGVTINGQRVPSADGLASSTVHAYNQMLTCAKSMGTQGPDTPTNGSGTLTLANGLVLPFYLDISGTLTEVTLTLHGTKPANYATTAPGMASFKNYAGPTTTTECGSSGVSKLGFKATFDNTGSAALVDPGTYPLSSGAGGSGGGGSGTGGGGSDTGGGGSGTSGGKGPSKRPGTSKRGKAKCKKGKKKTACKKSKKKSKKHKKGKK